MTWTRRGFAAACALVTASALAVGGALPAAATDTSPTPTPAASATAAPQAEQKGPIGGPGLAGGGIHVHYDPDATHLPAVWAKSWVLADLTSGDVLAAKSPHLKRPPASTLKTLTAVTLIPQLDPKSKYRAVYSDVAVEGSRAGIVDGATYTVDNLFYGLFLPSGNDAAHALANANGGVKHTIKQMNAEARHL